MGNKWTEREADEAMKREEIQKWSKDADGKIVVQREMTEKVTDPDWKK